MAITAQFLKGIMAEARPIIERQMDDAKLIAGFRSVVANAGGDWGALKALIKAHVEDENDETGDGKRVKKIVDKADDTAAYADMLDLANMNEKNFSDEQFDPETGEIHDADSGQRIGRQNGEQRGSAPVSSADGRGEDADDCDQGQGAGTPGTDRGIGPVAGELDSQDQDGGSCHVGGEVDHEITQSGDGAFSEVKGTARPENAAGVEPLSSDTNSSATSSQQTDKAGASQASQAAPANISDDDVPEFLKRAHKPMRPYCLNPDLCAGSGSKHCYSCLKARDDATVAA